MTPNPVSRIAIIGLGKAGRTIHLPALKKLKGVHIVGAYDVQGGGEALGRAVLAPKWLAQGPRLPPRKMG